MELSITVPACSGKNNLLTHTRSDISFSASLVSQLMPCPRKVHL